MQQSVLCPRPTSICPHVALLNEMATLKATMSHSARQLEETLKDEWNRRRIGGVKQMVSLKVYERFKTRCSEYLVIMEVVPFLVQMNQMMPVMVKQLLQVMVIIVEKFMGGMFHNVSQGFKILTMSLQTLITYWFLVLLLLCGP